MKDPLINGPILMNLHTVIEGLPDKDRDFVEDLFYRTWAVGYLAGLDSIQTALTNERLELPYPWSDWPVQYGKIVDGYTPMKELFIDNDQRILKDDK